MRRYLRTLVIAGLLISLSRSQAHGQSVAYPAEMTIAMPEAEVRSGPTDKYYPTSKLRQGEAVVVLSEVKEQPGWLAIAPPAGSFSWVDGKHVKVVGKLGYIEANDGNAVQILPGSSLINQEPNVKSQQLKSGTVQPLDLKSGTTIEIVDKALTINGQVWLPIKPHVSEVRFLRADAVKPPVALANSNGPADWTRKGELFTTNPQLAEAEQAYKAGNLERARQLYDDVARRSPDQNQKVFAMNRLASLAQGPSQPGYPANTTAWQSGPASTKTTSFSPSQPPAIPGGGSGLHALLPPQWSNYGYLRLTALEADGLPVYVIENPRGQAPLYVSTRNGTTLRDYVGKMVSVYGPTVYRGEGVRMQYIVASHVALP